MLFISKIVREDLFLNHLSIIICILDHLIIRNTLNTKNTFICFAATCIIFNRFSLDVALMKILFV